MIYKVFVDDSGSRDYKNPYVSDFKVKPPLFEAYPQFWRDNYFVLCGVRIHQSEIGGINKEINDLKMTHFKTNKVEIKSDWLRNPRQRQKYYLEKYNISAEKLNEFGFEIYEIIKKNANKMKIIGVVFDKRCYGEEKRRTTDGQPLLKAVQVLFERLQYTKKYHIVIFDQFECDLCITKGEHKKISDIAQSKDNLKKLHVGQFDKIIDVKFSKSSGENFIQIADLCAYNVYRQFLHFGREWTKEQGNEVMNMYEYFEKIRCNFMVNPVNGKVQGCGLVCLPDFGKCNWNLLKGCDLK
ncbi:MAG: hypothetical protein A2452_12330 [Candidatus Firestonebacteria bacterium RIFOXYC2_FULL_39_67]|nr:MAG: hypothetical protein A2536_07860 [Candidatus Firestonebacteria bacterium RIFOXYD2_FULL_39_29]OGF55634.1 MAG: hypothetical protein A2452_12330 [Candidatus Firestonebacteria bacterium RIFOXYC2_FULL_39_67]